MDSSLVLIFQLVVLIFSVIIHEVSHGAVALRLGDPTAKLAGRLTLNPLKHLDFFGSFLLPVALFILSSGSTIFGWAKPVPYNPLQLKNPKRGAGIIALAGPLSNLAVAVFFGLLIRILAAMSVAGPILYFLNIIVILNILLAVFNLVPLPPLDGSNILFSLLPDRYAGLQQFLMRYGFFILIFFIVFGFPYLVPIVDAIYTFLLGSAAIF